MEGTGPSGPGDPTANGEPIAVGDALPSEAGTDAPVREPSLAMSVAAVGVLVVMISTTVLIFGTDATGGPLQVALITSAVVAGLLALRLGHRVAAISDAVVGGVSSAMAAIFILLAVGALIGTWNMAGTIPTIVYYGLSILQPSFFYLSTVLICGAVGLTIGSSWTTAATLGVAFIALAPLLGADPVITAGAVISGAYFGDSISPLSEITVLVPSLVGRVTVNEHVGAAIWTTGPGLVISAVLFGALGLVNAPAPTTFDVSQAQATLAGEFNISVINLLPLILLIFFSVRKMPSFLSIFTSALFAGVLACFTQPHLVQAFVGGDAGVIVTSIKGIYSAMANGFVSNTGVEQIDTLFSRGGMSSMLYTIWLVLGALSYAAIMEHAGFLNRLVTPIVARAKSTGTLIAAVVGTSIGLNILAGDQYVAVVMPSRVYRLVFRQRGLAPRMLSRSVSSSGTVTSALVPWNSCGAYMSGVLGIATVAYFPYCFFNLITPVLTLLYGFTGFRIEKVPPEPTETTETAPSVATASAA
jgi:NhaC family Na+:H+ antiporter